MKVLQFIGSKGWGGAEKSFVELCNSLSKNIQIEVVLFEENQIEERLDQNIKIVKLLSASGRHNPFLYLELWKLIKKTDPDIIHTHSAKASEIIYMLGKFITVKQVATKRNPRKGSIFNKIDHVTAISEAVANSICKDDVDIIYNGLLCENSMPVKSVDPIFTLLAVGRLDKIKGFDILIKEVSTLDFPFYLNIVGEGDEKEHLEKLIVELGLSEKVTLLGYREDIPFLIAAADLVVISSHSEGFGRVLVETLFYGDLIISTKVGLSMEILPDELLIEDFEIAKKIVELYNNREDYHTLFMQLKKMQTKAFLLENISKEYIHYYQYILHKTKND
jgi:glycosyltransferase involved in cell wall biosynthesis